MNREQIRNPHRIYPGDVIVLDRDASGQWRLTLRAVDPAVADGARRRRSTPRRFPASRRATSSRTSSRPLVTGPDGLASAPEIVAGRDDRVIRGDGDVVYVLGIDPKMGDLWSTSTAPAARCAAIDTGEVLGYEQRYLGTGKVERFAEVSTVRITSASEEILIGDRLVPAPRRAHRQLRAARAGQADQRPHHRQQHATRPKSGRGCIVTHRQGHRRRHRRRAPCSRSTARSADIVDPRPSKRSRRDRVPRVRDPVPAPGPDVPARPRRAHRA